MECSLRIGKCGSIAQTIHDAIARFYTPALFFLACLTFFFLGLAQIQLAPESANIGTVPFLKVTVFLQDHGSLANSWNLFVHGEYKAAIQHPLYPLLLSSLGVAPPDLFYAGKMLSLIIGLAVVASFFAIARDLHGNLVAYVAVLLLAFNVTFLNMVSQVICESLLILFVLLSLYWIIKGFEKEPYWLWAGAAAGFAYLTKGTGLLLLPVFTATAVLGAGIRTFTRRWFWLFFLGFALTASPLIVRNLVVYHEPIHEGAVFKVPWMDTYDDHYKADVGWAIKYPEVVWDEDRFPTMRSYLATHSWADIFVRFRYGVKKEAQLLLSSLDVIVLPQDRYFGHLLFLFFMLGLALASNWAQRLCIVMTVGAFFVPFAWDYQVVPKEQEAVRFIAPLIPVICLYAAVGIVAILTAVDRRLATRSSGISLQKLLPPVLVVVCVATLGYVLGTYNTRLPGSLPPIPQDHTELYRWLEQNMSDDDLIMVSHNTPYWRYLWLAKFHGRWAFWLANSRKVQEESIAELTRLLGEKRARRNRYILFHRDDVIRTASLEPYFVWRETDGLRPAHPIEGWTEVYRHQERPALFLIYRVERAA
ncbi:MAG TPA: glycosyltransferase family 39 protein [Nitrospiraceae bacterium]|nr:glycosyltransferase family 39 protein [Nitrospiraceae bacterium]